MDHLEAVSKVIGDRARKVLLAMKPDWSYPMHIIAVDTGLKKTQVRRAMKVLKAHGLADLGPCWNEDDGLLHGSGYLLTGKGEALKEYLERA